jgi:hypothetical protein
MTIICVDSKGTMAADGQIVCDSIIISRTYKKIVKADGPNGPALCAIAGTTLFEMPAIEWYEKGAKPEEAPKSDSNNTWLLVVVDRNGVCEYSWDTPYPDYNCPTPWAWGANRELAIALMRSGKSAAEAAAFVCDHTISAGGEIQVVNIAEALGQLREAAE